VNAHRLATIVSTATTFESTLVSAMSYGPPAAGVWAVIQLIRALRRRMRIRSA
jgi:hypothetical protein